MDTLFKEHGAGDYLAVPYSSLFDLSQSQWTIEAWVNIRSRGGHIVSKDTYGQNFDWCIRIQESSIGIWTNGGNSSFVVSYTVPLNTWTHIAIVRSSVTKMYVNGVSIGESGLTLTNASQSFITIGCASWNNPGEFTNGYIRNLVIAKTARYTSNFTPASSFFSKIDNSAAHPVLSIGGIPSSGTRVIAVHRETGASFKTTTDSQGRYSLETFSGETDVLFVDPNGIQDKLVSRIQ